MKIVVLVKQIPDVNKIRFNPETGRIVREGVELMMNSFDKKALEESLRIRERITDTKILAVSMGPPQAIDVLNESLKFGVDEAYLISDRLYGGSDTWATAKIISEFINKERPDMVLAGKYSLDGETSQVPPEIARMCNYNFISSAIKIDIDGRRINALQSFEKGTREVSTLMPVVISVDEKINKIRAMPENVPDMREKVKIADSKYLNFNFNGAEESLTVVKGTSEVKSSRSVKLIDIKEAIKIIREEGRKKSQVEVEYIEVPASESKKTCISVGLSDPNLFLEIAGKCQQISLESSLRHVAIGNISPESVKDLPASEYRYFKSEDPSVIASTIEEAIKELKPEFVIFPSTNLGRDVSSFIAADMSLGLTADCIDIKYENEKLIQYKPAFGGGVLARIESKKVPAMASVRPGIFIPLRSKNKPSVLNIETKGKESIEIRGESREFSTFPSIQGARIVFGIGRGVKGKGNVQNIANLIISKGFAVAGTRPVVDMHFLPREVQVGLTGVSISPDLYVALGVSGHDNHMVGLRYAKKILAVNSQNDAPIFNNADYGCIASVEEFIKELENL
ncbi:FAD-binding protein [Caldiplasma sukawensis]